MFFSSLAVHDPAQGLGAHRWNGFSVFQDQRSEFPAASTGGGTSWLAPGVPRALGSLPGHPALPAARVPQVGTAQAALWSGQSRGGLSGHRPGHTIPWEMAWDSRNSSRRSCQPKSSFPAGRAAGLGHSRGRVTSLTPPQDISCHSCRVTQQQGVDLAAVQVSAGQQFLQVRPRQHGSLEDMWQVR